MRKLLVIGLLLIPFSFGWSESSIPPFEIEDPSISENFRDIYYAVDHLGIRTNPDGDTCIDNPTLCVNPETDVTSISGSGGTLAFRVNADGSIVKPAQPSFLVTNGSTAQTNITGDNTAVTVNFGTEIYDLNSDFSASTFTAPVDGKYFLTAMVRVQGILSSHIQKNLIFRTSNRNYTVAYTQALAQATNVMSISVIADMDANDTAYVQISVDGSTKVIDILGAGTNTNFSGSLIN